MAVAVRGLLKRGGPYSLITGGAESEQPSYGFAVCREDLLASICNKLEPYLNEPLGLVLDRLSEYDLLLGKQVCCSNQPC
jgi:hypothetical protein